MLVTVSDTGQALRPNYGRNGGLGLLIVQRILQLHGSSIELRSEAGKGAVFCFALKAAGRA